MSAEAMAEQFAARARENLRMLEDYWTQGLAIFKERADPAVTSRLEAGVSQYLSNTLDDSDEICSNEDFGLLLALALETLLSADLDAADPMLIVLICLRPLDPRPYSGVMTSVWEREGVAAAAEGYRAITQVLQNPLLLRDAALCLLEAGQKENARQALDAAWKNLEGDDDPFAEELRIEICEMQRSLNGS